MVADSNLPASTSVRRNGNGLDFARRCAAATPLRRQTF